MGHQAERDALEHVLRLLSSYLLGREVPFLLTCPNVWNKRKKTGSNTLEAMGRKKGSYYLLTFISAIRRTDPGPAESLLEGGIQDITLSLRPVPC